MEPDKGKIERHRLGIQETLSVHDTACAPLSENDGRGETPPQIPSVILSGVTTNPSKRGRVVSTSTDLPWNTDY